MKRKIRRGDRRGEGKIQKEDEEKKEEGQKRKKIKNMGRRRMDNKDVEGRKGRKI